MKSVYCEVKCLPWDREIHIPGKIHVQLFSVRQHFSRYSHTTATYFCFNTIKETHQTILGFLTATWVQVSAPGVQWKPINLF